MVCHKKHGEPAARPIQMNQPLHILRLWGGRCCWTLTRAWNRSLPVRCQRSATLCNTQSQVSGFSFPHSGTHQGVFGPVKKKSKLTCSKIYILAQQILSNCSAFFQLGKKRSVWSLYFSFPHTFSRALSNLLLCRFRRVCVSHGTTLSLQ